MVHNWSKMVPKWFKNIHGDTVETLTDVTLSDQPTNLIQADNANMAIQGNMAMKVTQSSGQLWNQCKRRHPLTKF